MIVGVVGAGVVGKATARSYVEHCEVRVYDKVANLGTHTLPQVLESDIIFLCLPTPENERGGGLSTGILNTFFEQYAGFQGNLVLRSTVPIGFTQQSAERWNLPNLVHSPEFLTARCSTVDAMIPTRNLIGGITTSLGKGMPDFVPNSDCESKLSDLYLDRFPSVVVFHLYAKESEAIKLFTNAFFAVKVSFWNEMRTLADTKGLGWDAVMNCLLLDGRIHPSHTKVPGPDGKRGFGGTCLPKDLSEVCRELYELQLPCPVSYGSHLRNQLDRRHEGGV